MSDLLSISQEERDRLLSTLQFADTPTGGEIEHWLASNGSYVEKMLNYSQAMADIDPHDTCCPEPASLRNGDCIRFGDYRGVGSRYVLWLKKGIYKYNEEDLKLLRESILAIGNDGEKSDSESKKTEVQPNTVELDCYMFEHADEYGRMAPPIASSQPPGYYDHLEHIRDEMMWFDPLLTVSTSHFGQMCVEAKKTDEWKNNADFPLQYIGLWDGSRVEWTRIEETSCHEISDGYFQHLRDIFNKHFF